MSRGIDVVFPDRNPNADPGWRLHLTRDPGEVTRFAEERVLPEKVDDPKAHAIFDRKGISLNRSEVLWLRDQLTLVLMAIDEEGGAQ